MNKVKINGICIVTESSELTFHRTKLALQSFLSKNTWFSGTIVIFTLKSQPLTKYNINFFNQIHHTIKFIEIEDDEFYNSLDSLRLNCLKIEAEQVIYISRDTIIFRNIRRCLNNDRISSYEGNKIEIEVKIDYFDSRFMCIPRNSMKKLKYDVAKSMYEEKGEITALFNKLIKMNNIEVNQDVIIVNSIHYPNNKYSNFVRYNKSISGVSYDPSLKEKYRRINGYWIYFNKKMDKEFTPSKVKINEDVEIKKETSVQKVVPKRERRLSWDPQMKLKTIRNKGEFNPDLYNRASIEGLSVTITTMIWKRHNIFKLWAKGIKRLKEAFPEVKINVLVAGSEREKSRNLVEKYRFTYIEHPNFPLGSKANARLSASKQFNSDYVILVGSDDIISNNCFLLMTCKMAEGYDEIAPLDIYYYDIRSKVSMYSHGYQGKRTGEPVAVGRCLSKNILDKVNWRLWSDKENAFLDGWSRDKINSHNRKHFYYSCRESGVVICDIKSDINMTPFKKRYNYEEVPIIEISSQIPEI